MGIRDTSYFKVLRSVEFQGTRPYLSLTTTNVRPSGTFFLEESDISGNLIIFTCTSSSYATSSVGSFNGFVGKLSERDFITTQYYSLPVSCSNVNFEQRSIVAKTDLENNLYISYPSGSAYNLYKCTSLTSCSLVDRDYGEIFDIKFDIDNKLYFCGYLSGAAYGNKKWFIKSSSLGTTGTVGLIDLFSSTLPSEAHTMYLSGTKVYAGGFLSGTDGTFYSLLRSGTLNAGSSSFNTVDLSGNTNDSVRVSLISSSNNNLYFYSGFATNRGNFFDSNHNSLFFIRTSSLGGITGTFTNPSTFFPGGLPFGTPFVDGPVHYYPEYDTLNDEMQIHTVLPLSSGSGLVREFKSYWFGITNVGGSNGFSSFFGFPESYVKSSRANTNLNVFSLKSYSFYNKNNIMAIHGVGSTPQQRSVAFNRPERMGSTFLLFTKLTANSESLGPITFAPSIAYARLRNVAGIDTTVDATVGYSLGNVSEFPHSSGLFQMKNMLLGTTDSGKIGNTDDSIIKINHIGSTVKIMWPKQTTSNDSLVTGYGDLSVGQSIGKLSNILEPGDFFEVTEFDHMALYCYLLKQTSGSLDDVVIQVERKPLTNVGFTTEQAVSISTSGSVAEGRLRDFQYVKEIDYGDLSIREIGWPIDIPLTNVKQVRISAKHKTGQNSDLNKNLIIYGRFIKADKNQTET